MLKAGLENIASILTHLFDEMLEKHTIKAESLRSGHFIFYYQRHDIMSPKMFRENNCK